MRELVFLLAGLGTELVERDGLGVELTVKQVKTLGEELYETAVGQLAEFLVTHLIVEAGETLAARHRLHLHHDTIEVVVTVADVLHDFERVVKTPVQNVVLALQHRIFTAQAVLGRGT